MRPGIITFAAHLGLAVLLLVLGSGCRDEAAEDPFLSCNVGLVRGETATFASDRLTLPKASGAFTFAFDFDGDGKNENQLKTLMQVAAIGGLDVDGQVASATAAGQGIVLFQLTTPDLSNAECARLTLSLADPPQPGQSPPKFDGSDVFSVADVSAVTLYGSIADGVFSSILPKKRSLYEEQILPLHFYLGAAGTVELPLHGVHVEARLVDEQGKKTLRSVALHGVLPVPAVQANLVPLIVRLVTEMIHRMSAGKERDAFIKWFEDDSYPVSQAKCQIDADCCRRAPATCKLLPEEIMLSPVGGVLMPDLQAFDLQGNWELVPAGREKNGLSVGLGLRTVAAGLLP